MKINFIIATLLVVFIVAIAGCTSPTPSPAAVSPTAVPTAIENASPTPVATASPSATVIANASPTAMPSQLATTDKLSASDISIDWDTTDAMQHNTVHLRVKNNDKYMVMDVDVIYTAYTQGVIVNPDNTSYTQNQTSGPVTVQLGRINAGEVKDVTIQAPDIKKGVPAYVTITVNWREGSMVVFQGVLDVPDHALGTKTY
ncbi:MAG TPA: hypothetical protein VGK13_01625 [Methanocellaceae archaeon]